MQVRRVFSCNTRMRKNRLNTEQLGLMSHKLRRAKVEDFNLTQSHHELSNKRANVVACVSMYQLANAVDKLLSRTNCHVVKL